MANYEELGLMIREARLAKGMSLGQLASAIGRSSSSIRRWERGEVAPAVSVLPKLSAILEVDLQDEMNGQSSAVGEPDGASRRSDEGDGRISTVEQPVVSSAGTSVPSDLSISQPASAPETGFLAGLWGALTRGGQGWMGWVRGLLTAGALVLMLLVLLWALGELFDALGAVLDSFDVGSGGDQA